MCTLACMRVLLFVSMHVCVCALSFPAVPHCSSMVIREASEAALVCSLNINADFHLLIFNSFNHLDALAYVHCQSIRDREDLKSVCFYLWFVHISVCVTVCSVWE